MSKPAVVYRMWAATGDLLYIGHSTNVAGRLSGHATTSAFWDSVVRIEVEHFPTREDALDAEALAIGSEKPAFNIAHQDATPDEVAARRERRGAGEFYRTRYPLHCGNCGHLSRRFPVGQRVEEVPCGECGVNGFEGARAA